MSTEQSILWMPSASFRESSNLYAYTQWLRDNRGLGFSDYESCRKWSVSNIADFWESIWDYFQIRSHTPYSRVLEKPESGMIGTAWFTGAMLNYTEHIFRNRSEGRPAIIHQNERKELQAIGWRELEDKVSAVAAWLRSKGVIVGDRVAAIMPNTPETVIAFLAANSLGAVWSTCSPDFGEASLAERLVQIGPKVIFFTDGYMYNGRPFDKRASFSDLKKRLPTLEQSVLVPFLDEGAESPGMVNWTELLSTGNAGLHFVPVPFGHPLWVLFSSGTTGKPKAITHSVGGCLLEHMKSLILHQDVKPGERYLWFSTTGWMMWNYALSSMLCGATLVLYEGSASYPGLNTLWDMVSEAGVHHFGAGAAFLIACMRSGLTFTPDRFPVLRSLGSTGSPLSSDAFHWVYERVKKDLWLISLSGGTDVCSGLVGGSPWEPVCAGEIQCRLLGCDVEAFDVDGKPVRGEVGEMVIRQPMPTMPICFWDDPEDQRYHSSYFEIYPGIWRHGDWIEITARGTVLISGRSDATLNRDGVRIGTAEIYSVLDGLMELADSLVVCLENKDGSFHMPLFVVMKSGHELTAVLKKNIDEILSTRCSPRHVPDEIIAIEDVPYTISGKKMETPVKKILMGMEPAKATSRDAMRNPSSLDIFLAYRK
jgi:acetoacetyl-CoA synthetase